MIKIEYISILKMFPVVNGRIESDEIVITTNGKRQRWKIVLRLIKDTKFPSRVAANWDDIFEQVDLKSPLDNVVAQYWTEHGSGIITRSKYTIVRSGKNIGKKNATNVFTQALSEITSRYNKKLAVSPIKTVYPMAAHKLEDNPKNVDKKIKYPAFGQPKLDGIRTTAHMTDSGVKLYSRKRKPINMPDIQTALECLYKLISDNDIYLDGELYCHGMPLQVISGIVRNENKQNGLTFNIFDVFYLDRKQPFSERLSIMQKIRDLNTSPLIVFVDTFIINSPDEEMKYYTNFLSKCYEGSIIRNVHGIYEYGESREKRSWDLRKHKPRHDAEFKLVGYNKGKDNGIIWVLQTNTEPPVIFTSVPNMSYEERLKLYTEMTDKIFSSKYLGKILTVQYDDLSDKGVPLRAKVKCFRDID